MARDQDEDQRSATPEESLAAFARHRENVIENERLEREREEKRRRQERAKPRTPNALPLDYFADIETAEPKRWLIKNVIARGEMSSWIGAPGAAKSALLTDIAVHEASAFAEAWRGYKIREHCGVVYFALERAALVKRRLQAYRIRDQIELSTPIAVSSRMLDLLNPQCINVILATITEAEQRFGKAVGLIIIDTFSKGISAAGGDEDKARDQNKVAAHMRRILERQELHIAGIGHTGKDESRGERGSNARVADVDLRIVISGDKIKSATVDKANDQAEGPMTSFGLESVQLGQDEDGEPLSVGIVSPIAMAAEKVAKPVKLSDREILRRAIMNTYWRLADDEGVKAFGLDAKPVVKIKVDRLREDLIDRGMLEKVDGQMPSTVRSQFRHARASLVHDGKLIEKSEMIWAP